MYFQKKNLFYLVISILLTILVFKNCKKINDENQKEKTQYTKEQKNEFAKIISAIIIPEQKQFPSLLTFSKPQKLFITKKTNALTDSIDISYLSADNLFNISKLVNTEQQNNYELKNLNEILDNINLSNVDSTKGTITKIVYIPIINSSNDNAFVRLKTLYSGHFIDTRDYWLQKENETWKIVKEEMILWH